MAIQESAVHYLSVKEAENIQNTMEREFALRCLAVGCLVVHQVPVGHSVIDFFVVNPKRQEPSGGILVEVTQLRRDELMKKEKTSERKRRQIEAMKNSGFKSTMLFGENMHKILAS